MIPAFPQVGGTELLILLVIILLLFGAKRIPELARSLGRGTREFRKGVSEAASDEVEERKENKEETQLPLSGTSKLPLTEEKA
jgi:sec-independent protein translocase protein TatA